MNFLESTNFFVRVTVYDYHHHLKSIRLKFRLIPMVHVGEQKFYDSVKEKILECDELIYEGIEERKKMDFLNTRNTLCENLGLVTQNVGLKLKDYEGKLTHGDYTKEEAEAAWKEVKWKEKITEKLTNPIERYFVYRKLTRRKLGKYFMQSYRDNHLTYGPSFDETGTSENFYMAGREQKVLDLILERIALESRKDKLIGIIYGARHMNRISRNLIDKRGYHVRSGVFLKVFDII